MEDQKTKPNGYVLKIMKFFDEFNFKGDNPATCSLKHFREKKHAKVYLRKWIMARLVEKHSENCYQFSSDGEDCLCPEFFVWGSDIEPQHQEELEETVKENTSTKQLAKALRSVTRGHFVARTLDWEIVPFTFDPN